LILGASDEGQENAVRHDDQTGTSDSENAGPAEIRREFEAECALIDMATKVPTIELKGRKWKIWIVDETDVTITVRVRPLRASNAAELSRL
jgi:hypothetical protein